MVNVHIIDTSLQRIEGLDALVNLEELWLGKNKIPKLEVFVTSMVVDRDANSPTLPELGQAQET